MPEGLSNEQPPEDVSDLLTAINDPERVEVMRRALAEFEKEQKRPALSLLGEEGRKNAEKLRLLSLGQITLEEAGPGFYRREDGVLGIKVDEKTAALLPWRHKNNFSE